MSFVHCFDDLRIPRGSSVQNIWKQNLYVYVKNNKHQKDYPTAVLKILSGWVYNDWEWSNYR